MAANRMFAEVCGGANKRTNGRLLPLSAFWLFSFVFCWQKPVSLVLISSLVFSLTSFGNVFVRKRHSVPLE